MSIGLVCLFFGFWGGTASAGTWVLDETVSTISFGSIKKDAVGESHSFTELSGDMDSDGNVTISINLASVETWIDKRNGRIIEHVFQDTAAANITASVDMQAFATLNIGAILPLDVTTTLTFLDKDVRFDAALIAVRLSESKVMIVSDGMAFFSTEELGVDAGVTKLMELAKLPSITRAVPVTVRLVFDAAQ
ncbi:MAG: YceI family protein [Paracoccaceae bacterium]